MKNIFFGILIGAIVSVGGVGIAQAAKVNTVFTDIQWGWVKGDKNISVYRLYDAEKNNTCYFAFEAKNVPVQMDCVGE